MNRKCPICQSTEKNTLIALCGNMKIFGDTFPDSGSDIVECNKCGCVFIDMEGRQADFNTYYNSGFSKSLSYTEVFGEENTHIYYNKIHENIKNQINYESQILDLGCGLGDFTKFLMNNGYNNIIGIDPSEVCIKNAKKAGINAIISDSFTFDELFLNKFDMVIVSHVLEHILDINEALFNIKKMLKPNGFVYIEVPDASKYCDVDFAPYFFFTYEHLIHLTRDTMLNIEKSFGLELVEYGEFFKCNSYYVLFGVYKNCGEFSNVTYSSETKFFINKYIDFCRKNLKPIIEHFEKTQEEIILWGIGASTAQLLNSTFDNCNVIALVDSNPSRQGIEFNIANNSYIVQAPESVIKDTATILILPIMYRDSIKNQIEKMGFKNKITSLS